MTLVEFLQSRKGVYASIVTSRPLTTKELSRGNKERVIIKNTVHRIRLGVNRDAKKAVIEARANGTAPATNQGLKGKEWLVFPILKRGYGNRVLIPVHVSNNSKLRSESTFIENGVDIGRDGYVEATIPSLHKRSGLRDMYDLNIDHIVNIKCGDDTLAITDDVKREIAELIEQAK